MPILVVAVVLYYLEMTESLRGLKALYLFVNVPSPLELVITQFDHVRIRLISQLIKCISRVVQNVLMCFNGTAISKFFVLPAAGIFPFILSLNLKNSESVIAAFGSSLQYCHKFLMFLNNYCYILLNYTSASKQLDLLHYLLLYYLFRLCSH